MKYDTSTIKNGPISKRLCEFASCCDREFPSRPAGVATSSSGQQPQRPIPIAIPKGAFSDLSALAIAVDGDLIVADRSKGIFKVTADGKISSLGQGSNTGCSDFKVLEYVPLKTGYLDVTIYLAGISTSDESTLYILRTNKLPSLDAGVPIKLKAFTQLVSKLTPLQGNSLNDDGFVSVKLKKNGQVRFSAESESFQATVTESHYFKGYIGLRVCR
jgi:hypothetical protein